MNSKIIYAEEPKSYHWFAKHQGWLEVPLIALIVLSTPFWVPIAAILYALFKHTEKED